MRKALIITFLLVLGLSGLYFLLRSYYHFDPANIIEQIRRPSQDITKLLPQGSDLGFPLNIPEGFRIAVFANLINVGAPRVLAFDPDGNLVASIPSAGKLVVLPDKNNDGIADQVIDLIHDLDRPHGIAFSEGTIYIAETGRVIRFAYRKENMTIGSPQELFKLPKGGRHFTRTIKVFEDKLYTSVGSSCDVCIEKDWQRGSILVSNLDGSDLKLFAKGLRNTVFFVFDPSTSSGQVKIWGNDMGRDFLGDNLPPDELNLISIDKDYGWPVCYGSNVHDETFDKAQYRIVAGMSVCEALGKTQSQYNYPAHVAPLGLTFINSPLFSKDEQGNILSAFHGSWNSTKPVGYKIVKLNIQNDKVVSMEDFITGFIKSSVEVLGRPVDLVFDKDGILYISDDKANLVYILTKEN